MKTLLATILLSCSTLAFAESTTYFSDGSYAQTYGNTTYYSDGSYSQTY